MHRFLKTILIAAVVGVLGTLSVRSTASATAPSARGDGLLAFVRGEQVVIISPESATESVVALPAPPQGSMSWLPDGRRLAVTVGPSPDETRIVIANPLAGTWFELPDTTNGSDPSISADGEWLAYQRREGESSGIWVVRTNGENARAISGGMEGCYDASPSWSPDGRELVFVRSDSGGDWRLMVMNADGTTPRFLFPPQVGVGDLHPDWSPDGQSIAFTRYNGGSPTEPSTFEIWTANRNGTSPRLVIESAQMPRWLPSTGHTRLVYRSDRDDNLNTLDFLPPATSREVPGTGGGRFPAWGPAIQPFEFVLVLPQVARD